VSPPRVGFINVTDSDSGVRVGKGDFGGEMVLELGQWEAVARAPSPCLAVEAVSYN
jgi:hypothetical protein